MRSASLTAWSTCIPSLDPREIRLLKPAYPNRDPSLNLDEIAFAELIVYIEKNLEANNPVVRILPELVKFTRYKLQELGAEHVKANVTRLRNRVLI